MSLILPSRRLAPAWVRNDLWRRARAVPSLDLQFADRKSLVDAISGQNLITFTRASSGTYVDSDGVLQTAATNEPRFDHNPTTGECLGLLVEEQRTNLLLNSATLSTQSVIVTAAAHTLSFTGTGTITLSGTSTAGPLVGTGTGEANRVSLTFTPTAGTLTLTVSGTVSNAQLEVGAFRTSYIPTTTAAVTRNADVVSITGTNFSSWYRQDEGAVFAEYIYSVTGVQNQCAYSFDNGTSAESLVNATSAPNIDRVLSFTGGIPQANFGNYVFSAGQTIKRATSISLNDAATSANGSTVATDTSYLPPTPTQLIIGAAGYFFASRINGTIRRLSYWPSRLPNTTLQSITQ